MATSIGMKLVLVTPVMEIANNIVQRCASELNRRLNTTVLRNALRKRTQELLRNSIMAQPEYNSLITEGSKLNTELGLPNAHTAMDAIINIWLRGVEVVNSPILVAGPQVTGNFTIQAVRGDYSDVLGAGQAKYRTEKGDMIPWLEWLLTAGDAIIIATHKAVYEPKATSHSRTGYDIMVPNKGGVGWRVPPEFSGTIDNNFVTRAAVEALPLIGSAIQSEIRSKV